MSMEVKAPSVDCKRWKLTDVDAEIDYSTFVNQAALKNRVHQLVDACHALELAILRRQAPNVCRQQCDGIIGQWQQIRPALAQCTTPEALAINDMIATFTPELIRLRTMLGD